MPEYVSSTAPSPLPCSVHCGGDNSCSSQYHPHCRPSAAITGSRLTDSGVQVGKQQILQSCHVHPSPAVPWEGEDARSLGGRQEIQPRKAIPYREQISQFPLAQQGMELSHSGEVGKPIWVAGVFLERPEWCCFSGTGTLSWWTPRNPFSVFTT